MADEYVPIGLGDVVDDERCDIRTCIVVGATVTKGDVVEATHLDDDMPKVTTAALGSVTAFGVAMQTGIVGASILVCLFGIVKVTAGAGGVTAGKTIIVAGTGSTIGTVCDGVTAGSIIGRALQTIASGGTGLVFIGHA
jgi:hypothetical protein